MLECLTQAHRFSQKRKTLISLNNFSPHIHFAGVFQAVHTFFSRRDQRIFRFSRVDRGGERKEFSWRKKKVSSGKLSIWWSSRCCVGSEKKAEAMAGFLEEWRKPSRLLQDVKTKSIERTLLPLIKQVRRWKSRSLDDWKIGWKVKIKVFLWMRWWRGIILVFVGCYFKMPIRFFSSSTMCVNYRRLAMNAHDLKGLQQRSIHHIITDRDIMSDSAAT